MARLMVILLTLSLEELALVLKFAEFLESSTAKTDE